MDKHLETYTMPDQAHVADASFKDRTSKRVGWVITVMKIVGDAFLCSEL